MSKPTPGPWTVNEQTPNTVITPRGRISVAWHSNVDDGLNREAEANARLIAAAPALLAACKAVLADDNNFDLTDETWDALKAAVAKAEDGTP